MASHHGARTHQHQVRCGAAGGDTECALINAMVMIDLQQRDTRSAVGTPDDEAAAASTPSSEQVEEDDQDDQEQKKPEFLLEATAIDWLQIPSSSSTSRRTRRMRSRQRASARRSACSITGSGFGAEQRMEAGSTATGDEFAAGANSKNRRTLVKAATLDQSDQTASLSRRGTGVVDAKDEQVKAALVYAAEGDRAEVAQELLRNRADSEAKDNDDRKAELYRVQPASPKELIAGGTFVNIVSETESAQSLDGNGGDVASMQSMSSRAESRFVLARSSYKFPGDEDTMQVCSASRFVEKPWGTRRDRKDDAEALLLRATVSGRLNLVREQIESGVAIDAKNPDGRMALSLAAEWGHVDVVEQLIKYGAAVDAKDDNGRAALLHTARSGHVNALQQLVKHGAVVDAKDNDGRTALSYAAEAGHINVVQELIEDNRADVNIKDNNGRGALFYAARKYHRHVIADILRWSAFETADHDSNESLALFVAAALGDSRLAMECIEEGHSVEAMLPDGRTPLFVAAQCGQTKLMQILIDSGASVSAKSNSSHLCREGDTPLTIAGRAGHMEMFEELVKAGAPVNVRDCEGETPLLSAARWDFFAGVQLLIAHGGCLRESDMSEGEYPLIPSTLETMSQLCAATFEFDSLCSHVVQRSQNLCSQLQQKNEKQIQEGALTSFTSMLFRFCRLLLGITKLRTLRSRFISSRALSNRIRDFHEELDHFADMLGFANNGGQWSETWENDQASHQLRFTELLMNSEVLFEGCNNASQKRDVAMLLQYELKSREEKRFEVQGHTKAVLTRFLWVGGVEAPTVPDWFISREDVEYHSWNFVRSEGSANIYRGKWRQSSVMIETSDFALDAFNMAATKWFQLSHPNVVRLFGACHVGSPFVFVYERVPEGRQLQDFLSDKPNQVSLWKRIYEAALGLQYIHNRDIVHGDIRSENIVVGSDRVAKWNVVCEDSTSKSVSDRCRLTWVAPELMQNVYESPKKTQASDMYAFGMCVWEALTLEIPWKGHSLYEIYSRVSEEILPERPASIPDAQWDLIAKMCAADPSERATIAYVVNRLKQLVVDHEQRSEAVGQDISSFSGSPTEQHTSMAEHVFGEIGETIPKALRMVQYKWEKLADKDQWMTNGVYPALDFIFALLEKRNKVPTDVEVVKFCAVLSRFQRYLRTTVSEKSVFQLVRSRRVAHSNRLIYSELDRLLDLLDVADMDAIRVWRGEFESEGGEEEDVNDDGDSMDSTPNTSNISNGSSEAVLLTYFPSPTAHHELWTRDGLAARYTSPSWALPLQDLEFSESNQIGQGSFGAVYKGAWLDTPVVIKFMGYEEDCDTISTDLLLHEVRVWHRLNHPHVLKLFGANYIDKRYFVCEFASHGDLIDYLKEPGNETLVWQKLYETALGLQYLHGQNVAHNDLKCDNIMVGAAGKAKLIDFGLSCLLNEAEIQINKKKMGAVNWRSPEYLAGGRPSFASDVYSFAMCIIEVVSGDIPWGRPMVAAVARFQLKKGGSPRLADSMNEKQQNMIELMTKFEPSERVKMAFVVDKLSEIAQDQKSMKAP